MDDRARTSAGSLDQLVFNFNTKPDLYLDHSWLSPSVASIWGKLTRPETRSPTVSSHLNSWLFRNQMLSKDFDFDFMSNKSKRILLVDKLAFEDIARMLGLALFSLYFRKLITKQDRSKLRTAIGEQDYAFMHDFILPWPTVGVVGSANCDIEVLLARASSVGAWALASSFVEYEACTSRALLKLARKNAPFKSPRNLKTERKQRIWDFMTQLVINERHPQWRWLF
jgi:hypothetical protein